MPPRENGSCGQSGEGRARTIGPLLTDLVHGTSREAIARQDRIDGFDPERYDRSIRALADFATLNQAA